MKIIISHKKTKRAIIGPFNICGSRKDLTKLRDVLNATLETDWYSGWVSIKEQDLSQEGFNIIKEQNPIINTEPVTWEDNTSIYDKKEKLTE